MRLKRLNAGVRVCTLLSFVLLLAMALTATSALALTNPERHYEMVSPPYKGGYSTTNDFGERVIVAPDGESVAFFSAGAFNGAPTGFFGKFDYLARRDASGWSTASLLPPSSLAVNDDESDLSESLDQVFTIASPGSSHELPRPDEADLLLHATDQPDVSTEWESVGSVELAEHRHLLTSPAYDTSSNDFCHILLTQVSLALLPSALGAVEPLYEFSRGCDGEASSLQLVDVNNADAIIAPKCHTGLGGAQYSEQSSKFNAMSAEGGTVFFTVCVSGEATGPTSPHQLFVRLGGSRTLEVSRPLGGCAVPGEVPCADASGRASADFVGASEDGATVYFTTTAPLAPTDKDTAEDLYMATIGCPEGRPGCADGEREVRSLGQVSNNMNGGAAEVQGVVRVAPDGGRVYYIARGDLLSTAEQGMLEREGRPVPRAGADNLYVYDDAGQGTTSFIGDLCAGEGLSGTVADIGCPGGESDAGLWSSSSSDEAQTAGAEGGFLVFASVAQLTRDDTNRVRDVYRYDAETDNLQRVSVGEDGFDANGNASPLGSSILPGNWGGSVFAQHELDNRAISEDGSRVVFISAVPLSPDASNGLTNAYEWHESPGGAEGRVSLVSTGSSEQAVINPVISESGHDVFFTTTQGLVPQDTDGAADVYDARLGAGFPQAPAETQPCQGDACQGPLTNPVALLIPGSVSQEPGGNLTPATPPTVAKAKTKAKAKGKSKKHKKKKRPRSSRKGGKAKRPSAGRER